MSALSHAAARLSTALLALALPMAVHAAPAAPASPFFGRWTVSDDKPVFTPRGREYQTFDIAPCGRDFCGVSVKANGQCGAELFRFLMIHNRETELDGHARWGNQRMKISIYGFQPDDNTPYRFELGIGDRHYSMNSRSGSMPKFEASYRKAGAAICHAR